jgi:cytochrome c oxidase assembly protein subunit 11
LNSGPSGGHAAAHATSAKNGRTASLLVMFTAFMVGVSFAAVPLYGIFCAVTGYGGTPGRALQSSGYATSELITVRFDANVSPNLPWKFQPVENKLDLRIGENRIAFYRVTNLSNETVTGTASYNVSPDQFGVYFMKVQCFCFQEQTLQPGETVEMPVSFFVDPTLLKDRDLENQREVTLSYTFFRVKKPAEPAKGTEPTPRGAI